MNTQTETKHTSGPWTVERYLGSGKVKIVASTGSTIATVNDEANAELIAASPELLEALRAVVADWELAVKSGRAIQNSLCTLLAVKSAIAKATEGAQ